MKRNYKGFITLSLIAASFTGFAQTDALLDTRVFSADEKTEILSGVQVRTIKNVNNKANCNDTITTPVLSGNGHAGVMFDVLVGANDLTVETFWVSQDTPENVAIFYKTGTFVGSELTSSAWTFLDSAITAGSGDGSVDSIPVSLNLSVLSNTTYAFYITKTGSVNDINYTNGTTVGNVLVSNVDLSVLEGKGGGYPFDVTFSPRTFNGRVQYCQVVVTSIDQALSEESISIYPNPATSELNIALPALNNAPANVSIYNVIGELVLAEQVIANGVANTLDISSLETGIYFVKVIANESEYSTKLFVK